MYSDDQPSVSGADENRIDVRQSNGEGKRKSQKFMHDETNPIRSLDMWEYVYQTGFCFRRTTM